MVMRETMKIEDAMSKDLIVAYVPGTIREALKTLAKNNVSGMPVLKRDTKTVVGVITRNDIFKNPDAMSLAPICNGMSRLLNVPLSPAVRTKKTMMVPCMVTRAR